MWSESDVDINTRKTGSVICLRFGHRTNWFLLLKPFPIFPESFITSLEQKDKRLAPRRWVAKKHEQSKMFRRFLNGIEDALKQFIFRNSSENTNIWFRLCTLKMKEKIECWPSGFVGPV